MGYNYLSLPEIPASDATVLSLEALAMAARATYPMGSINSTSNSRGRKWNKANLRDLIAATGLIILLEFDPNHRFSSPCGLEIWCMTSKNNRAPLLYYIKLCVSFQIHRWIQTEVTLWKRSIRVEIGDFLSLVTLKFDGCWKTRGHLFYTTSSFVHHFKSIGELKLKLQSRNTQFG